MALTPKQAAFVREYMVDLNATQAAIRAGYSKKNAGKIGPELLGKTRIADAIAKKTEKITAKTEVTAEQVLQRLKDIAFADPNELIHFRRTCCRYCFGKDHAYQWTDEQEHASAQAAEYASAKKEDRKPRQIDDSGGYGYDPTIRPHPKCPKCHGEGVAGIHAQDTRDLSPAAKALYAGVKQTSSGFEVLMHDQIKALEMLAKYHGLLKDRVEHSGNISVLFDPAMDDDT